MPSCSWGGARAPGESHAKRETYAIRPTLISGTRSCLSAQDVNRRAVLGVLTTSVANVFVGRSRADELTVRFRPCAAAPAPAARHVPRSVNLRRRLPLAPQEALVGSSDSLPAPGADAAALSVPERAAPAPPAAKPATKSFVRELSGAPRALPLSASRPGLSRAVTLTSRAYSRAPRPTAAPRPAAATRRRGAAPPRTEPADQSAEPRALRFPSFHPQRCSPLPSPQPHRSHSGALAPTPARFFSHRAPAAAPPCPPAQGTT